MRVKGAINEQSVGSLQEGTRVVIRSRIDSSLTWNGTVERVDWDNPISNNNMGYGVAEEFTGSTKYPFHIALDSDEGLILGQHVYIEPDVGEQQTGLMLPAFYINDAETSPWVWAENGRERLEKRSLTLGSFDEVQGTWEVLDGLTEEDYIAFPDETCVQGAKTIRYDEGSFGGDNGEDGGIGAYDENAVDGGFAEGDFAGKSDDGVIFDDAEAGIDWEAEGEAGAAG